MKSNFIIILSVFALAFVFCLPNSTWAQEISIDCTNSIKLVGIDRRKIDSNDGIITVKVVSNDEYECFLYKISGKGRELITTKHGVNDREISFSGLSGGNYTVSSHFKNADNLICSKLQVAGIFLYKE